MKIHIKREYEREYREGQKNVAIVVKNRHMGLTDKFRPAKKKVCNTCNKEKPAKDFPMQTENMDGRSSRCRECLKEIENQKKAQQAEYAKQFFTF